MPSRALQVLARVTDQSMDELEEVARVYPFAISPFIIRRVAEGTYSLVALRQFLPDLRELQDVDGFGPDPTGESGLHPERSVLQTYDNRLALILTHQCLVYCRFCFRKEFVGLSDNGVLDEDLDRALSYVAAHPEVDDILLSGGDPLALPNKRLIPFLRKLAQIPHLKTIRIHSRALSVQPERIDDELTQFLSSDDRFWYYAHMNHPDDISHPDVAKAIRRLLSARVPILNQSVILAGVNDDVNTMVQLMKLCYEHKVIPYNLYVLDRVRGAAHFEVPVDRIVEIYEALAQLPGPAQPVLVVVDSQSKKHRAVYDSAFDLKAFLLRHREQALATVTNESGPEPAS